MSLLCDYDAATNGCFFLGRRIWLVSKWRLLHKMEEVEEEDKEKEGETVVLIPDLGPIVGIVDLPGIIDAVILVQVMAAELQSLMVS